MGEIADGKMKKNTAGDAIDGKEIQGMKNIFVLERTDQIIELQTIIMDRLVSRNEKCS